MKNDLWKQPGPGMQLIAIVSGLKGHKSNFDTGIIDKKQFDEHLRILQTSF